MPIKTTPFDPADVLTSADDAAIFIRDALADERSEIEHALRTVARSASVPEIAALAGLTPEATVEALNGGIEASAGVLAALGLTLPPSLQESDSSDDG